MFAIAVNALAAEESDLRRAATGRWGHWEDGERREARSLLWVPLLLALLVLHLHLLVGRRALREEPS